ncbi:MAG: hypothetical protein ACOXZ6_05015 [Syntrophomonadaceae bacterium]
MVSLGSISYIAQVMACAAYAETLLKGGREACDGRGSLQAIPGTYLG